MNLRMVFSPSTIAMESALHAQWQRLRTISSNIANADTPGFQARRISFENELAREIDLIRGGGVSRREASTRLSNVVGQEYRIEGMPVRADGNNVSLINEQIELARIQDQYRALRQRITNHYSGLDNVIRGGRQ